MAATTATAAKAALIALLEARPALVDVNVSWAVPTQEADWKRDLIWLGKVEAEQAHIQLGGGAARRKDEDYTIEVWLQSYRANDDPAGTEAAWRAMQDELAAVVNTDPRLSGALNQYAQLEGFEYEPSPADGGWMIRGVCSLRCKAQI